MFICIMPIFHQIPGACEFKIALIKNNCEIIKQANFTYKILEKQWKWETLCYDILFCECR